MKKRGVLSLWKTIILVIAGLIGVAGVTVLALYLAGNFNEKHVEPTDMSFSQVIDDGLGQFNPDYYNTEDAKKSVSGRYEVSSDFKMTIISTTEGLTEDVVTLSLEGGRKVMDGQTAMVTDDVITVPQTVRLNKAFTVKLNTEYNQEFFDNWIVGGSSLLTATSENVILPRKSVRIFVDVPVKEIETTLHSSSQQGEVQEVVIGSSFTIDASFLPTASELMFSDENDTSRKMVVFSTTAEPYIRYNESEGVFYAEQKTDSATQLPTITAYTFANSYYQSQFLKQNANAPDLYDLLRNYFRANPTHAVTADIQVKVLDVDVDRVEVSSNGKTFSSYVDTYFTLTASSVNGDATLGLNIVDSKNTPLSALFRNVGIRLPKGETGIKILGGNLIKVTTIDGVATMTLEQYDENSDYFNAPTNVEYYLLPDTTPAEYANYFWRLSASEAQELTLSVNFFYEDENGDWKNFFDFGEKEKYFYFSAVEHEYEETPVWNNNNQIKMQINYNEDGSIDPAHIDLSTELNSINSENIYRTVRYFLFVDTNDAGYAQNLNMQEAFSCSQGQEYTLEISGGAGSNKYTLYAIDGTVLSALKSFAGKVKIIAATVRTDADKKPYMENGKYVIVQVSRAKEVVVESTLSISNMQPTFIIGDNITKYGNGEFYIPAINRNDSGDQKSVITFNLVLKNSEDTETDAEKLIKAYTDKKLELVCVDRNGNKTNEYVTLQGFTQKDVQDGSVVFEGSLTINEGLFSAGQNRVDLGTYIQLQLQYDDGKTVHKKTATNAEDLDHFYIYYQQPVKMQNEFEGQNDLDKDGDKHVDTIEINITTADGIKITWGNKEFTGTGEEKIDKLNELLTTTLIDQYGKEIDMSAGIYKARLVENPAVGNEKVVNLDETLSQISSFISTQGLEKTTTLYIQILDAEDNEVMVVSDGTLTQESLKSQELTLKILSEGVSKVEKDSSVLVEENPTYEVNKNRDGTLNIDTVYIEKYVSDEEIVLNKLIKVYTQDENNPVDNIVFMLDNDSLSRWSSDNKIDIVKMLNITTQDETQQPHEGENATKSIDDYKNLALKSVKVLNPFKTDTQLTFVARDSAGTLFNISLTLTFKSDISMSSNFEDYYLSHQDYLVKSGNALTLVAGQNYNLDEYLSFQSATGKKYSWLSALGTLADMTSVYETHNEIASLVKDDDKNPQSINLYLKEVYQFTTIDFTIYYGIKSNYAFSTTLRLYINPNFIVREVVSDLSSNPFVDLGGTQDLTSMYSIYKLTDFFNNGQSFNGLEKVVITNATYTNQSSDRYITITNNGIFGFEDGAILNLELGKSVEQEFTISVTTDSQALDAVKVKTENIANGKSEVVLCDAGEHLRILLDVGFGGSDPSEVAKQVLKRKVTENDSQDVEIINYNGKVMMLLLSASDFKAQDDFSFGNATGNLRATTKELTTVSISGFISDEGNTFKASKTLSREGKNLTVVLTLEAVITKVGEQFVYYSNAGEYNKYEDVTFDTLIGDYQGLIKANVSETLSAGKSYTIVHDIEKTENAEAGFYYNGTTADITTTTKGTTRTLSIVEDAEGYITGLATVEGDVLTINHLESKFENAYIILKLTLTAIGTKFSWYYRIHVTSDFEITDVTYPYANEGEYLDVTSKDFKENHYEINLNEQFANSNHDGKTRFGQLKFDSENHETTFTYSIKSVTVGGQTVTNWQNYFEYSFDNDIFTIKVFDATAELNLTITRKVSVDNVEMIGAEQDYLFIFNQGSNYVHSLQQTVDKDEEQVVTDLTAENNIYSSTISAGSGEIIFTPDIRISSNATESKVTKFNAYISGTDLEKALKAYYGVFAKGTVLYNDNNGTTEKEILSEDLKFEGWTDTDTIFDEDTKIYKTTVGDDTYYTKVAPTAVYAYLDNDNKLHITPKDSVDKDYSAEIGFFTEERVVFRLNLTITSYFTWSLNSEEYFKGGETYQFLKMPANDGEIVTDTIFTELKSTLTDKNITNVTLSLKDSKDEEYVKIVQNEIASDTTAWQEYTVEFAQLTQDTTFTFKATITATDNSTYTFDFTIKVSASFDATKTVEIVDTQKRYGTVNFTFGGETDAVTLESIKEKLGFKGSDEVNITEPSITPSNVSQTTVFRKEIELSYNFNNKQIFTTTFVYVYTVYPNVTVSTHYPKPDGETESEAEYITSDRTEVYEDFFNSKANFADDNRFKIEELPDKLKNFSYTITVDEMDNVYLIAKRPSDTIIVSKGQTIISDETENETAPQVDLTFSLTNTQSNGRVVFNLTCNGVSEQYTVIVVAGSVVTISTNSPNYSTNGETVYAEDLAKMSDQNLFVENRILNATFKASVAKDFTYYVRYTNGNTTKVFEIQATALSKAVNFDLGEQLTGYTYGGTFEDKESALSNNLTNKISEETLYESAPTITSRVVAKYYDGTPIKLGDNISLQLTAETGRKFLTYQFKEANRKIYSIEYITTSGSKKSTLLMSIDSENHSTTLPEDWTGTYTIYEINGPKKTVVKDQNNIFNEFSIIYELNPFAANSFKLTSSDYQNATNMGIQLVLTSEENTETTISTSGSYKFYLDVEFGVDNPTESADNMTIQTIYAGSEESLFDYYNTVFGIKNTRTGVKYTKDLMAESSGNFAMYIYGFDDNPIEEDSEVQKIHKSLINTNDNGIKHSTGLTPRAEETINEDEVALGTSADLTKNYITISGVPLSKDNSKVCDYKIRAQGCTNDGNYIMMKLVYTVDVGGTIIQKEFNIMFKVVPGPDTEVRFKSRQEEASTTNPGASELVEDKFRTVNSNYEAPYAITNGDVSFNLWNNNDSTATGENANEGQYVGVINAYLYGGKTTNTNSADKFTYTYTENTPSGYNDLTGVYLEDVINKEKVVQKKVTVPKVNLGERKFVIEAENAFGYKLRFYFTVTADVNPQIYSMSSTTLTEGDYVGVGLRYQEVTVQTEEDKGVKRVVYQPFEYVKDQNTITITNKNCTISNVKLTANISTTEGNNEYTYVDASLLEGNHYYLDVIKDGENSVNLTGAYITLEFTVTGNTYGTYSATYNSKALLQTHTVSSTYTNPSLGANAPQDVKEVILSGINAYGFDKNLGGIDSSTVEENKTYSNFNDIKVQRIDYYLGGKWLGGSVAGENGTISEETEAKTENNTTLYTDKGHIFVNSDKTVTAGEDFATSDSGYSKGFVVPTIDGIYFGTGTTLSNVTMRITLVEKTTNSEDTEGQTTQHESIATLDQRVTLTRKASSENMFVNNNIVDGSAPDVNNEENANNKFEGTVYNDTLEVKLDPGTSVTFAVTNKDDADANALTKITKTNNCDYAITEYVGISASIDGLITNLNAEERNKFYIYLFEKNGEVTFKYNSGNLDLKDDGYGITSDTEYDGSKTYYTEGEGKYTEFKPTLKTDISYYELVENEYKKTEDKEYDKSKTYYTESDDTYTKYNPFEEGVTYYEIVANKGSGIIDEYDNITLNIEHINELNNANYKTETLYFLFKGNNKVYQHFENFNVYPQAKSATHSNTDEQGNYIVEVPDYLKVSNGTNTYYVATLYQWANGITTNPYEQTTDNETTDNNCYSAPYKYYFEINTGTGGAGSAFIDENGMITTGEDFEVKTHTITVNVYMKVSGPDGNFEDSNTRLRLGQFRLYFKQDVKFEGERFKKETANEFTTTLEGSQIVQLIEKNGSSDLSNNILVIPTGYTVSSISGENVTKFYYQKVAQQYKYSTSNTFACKVGETVRLDELVGEEIFLFHNNTGIEGPKLNDWINKTYKVVDISTGSDENEQHNYIVRGSIGTWTFTTSGQYSVYILIDGRYIGEEHYGGGEKSTWGTQMSKPFVYKITMMVYDTSTRENYKVCVKAGDDEYDLNQLSAGYTWHELDANGGITQVTNGKVTVSEGVLTRQFLASKDGTFKIVNVTFYTYSQEKEFSVAVRPQTNFALSNLVEGTAEFYVNGTFTRIYNENIGYGEGSSITRTYFVITRNADGSVESAQLFKVNYKLISSAVKEESDYIAKDESISEKAEEIIKSDLNLANNQTLTLEEMADNGILTDIDEKEAACVYTAVDHANIVTTAEEGKELLSDLYEFVDGVYTKTKDIEISENKTYYKQGTETKTLIIKTYLATVTTVEGDSTFYRYKLTFYVYGEEKSVEYATVANTAFDLSELNESVRNALGADNNIAVSYYTLTNNTLTRVSTISLEEGKEVSYYVLVGSKYYKITFKFNVATSRENKNVLIRSGTYDLAKLVEGYTWYELDANGEKTAVENSQVTVSEGVSTRQFLAQNTNDNTFKIINIKFYSYTDKVEKSVDVHQNEPYTLTDALKLEDEKSAVFYDLSTYSTIKTETLTEGVGTIKSKTYFVLINNSDGSVSAKLIKITFNVVETTSTEVQG